MYTVITVPGIGEAASQDGAPVGMLKLLTDKLPEDRFRAEHFNWRNQYGPTPSLDGAAYAVNVEAAIVALTARCTAAGDDVVVCGYSGGADVASQVAAQLKIPLIAVANPRRRGTDSSAPFYGIIEPREDNENLVFDLANAADVIPCCPTNSPLRGFYELTKNFSLSDPDEWGRQLLLSAQRGAFRPAPGQTLNDWWMALRYVHGYLDGSQHVRWYERNMPLFAEMVKAGLP